MAVPSHVQVSPNGPSPPGRLLPPKSTTVPVTGSYAILDHVLGDGDTGGNCWVQVVPSHVQVSLREVPVPTGAVVEPPKSTMLPAAASKAIPGPWRAGGEAAGDIANHLP